MNAAPSAPRVSPAPASLLRERTTWEALTAGALLFGACAGLFEAVVDLLQPAIALAPWQPLYRTVESMLWIVSMAAAIAVAERWPVRTFAQWRRAVGQLGVGLVLGPLWGLIAFALARVFAPWRSAHGVWVVVGIEAKGYLFAYATAVLVAHVVVRAREQRARAVAEGALLARAAESRVQILTLGMQARGVLATLDASIGRAAVDPDGVNRALVQLAGDLGELIEASRDRLAAEEEKPDRVDQGVGHRRGRRTAGPLVDPPVRQAGERG